MQFIKNIGLVKFVAILVLVVTAFRLWYATKIGLVGDEAYYWLWSKHLAASYRDKGPAVAWTIALGTEIFGNNIFGIRFFAVVLSGGTAWLLFLLARKLYDEHIALWCLLMAAVTPMLAVGSILMTIDPLSVFFWTLAALLFWAALHNADDLIWFWLGLAIGAGFLAKFTNGVQLICIAFFLIWTKDYRSLLFSRKILFLGIAFLLACIPILWWNIRTGWVHITALHSRSGVTDTFKIHPHQLINFIFEQFIVVSPLFMAGIIVAAIFLLKPNIDLRTKFLLSQFLPIYGLFMFFSLNSAGKPNWTVPALVTGIVFTTNFWYRLALRKPVCRCGIAVAFAVALIMTTFLHIANFLPLPQKLDPMRRAQGWPDFATHIEKARSDYHTNLLIGSHYSIASLMSFYLPDQPTTYLPPGPYGSSQFSLWLTYRVTPDSRALFVASNTQQASLDTLHKQFKEIRLIDDFWSEHYRQKINHFYIFLCSNGS
ncbi:MAG TPA: glycosyltransferase family 39 protein [Verrucomicrobiae bacterium]|nr:glycosyltransferase family 39 protein [Verrucomicrobiae bacterium]